MRRKVALAPFPLQAGLFDARADGHEDTELEGQETGNGVGITQKSAQFANPGEIVSERLETVPFAIHGPKPELRAVESLQHKNAENHVTRVNRVTTRFTWIT